MPAQIMYKERNGAATHSASAASPKTKINASKIMPSRIKNVRNIMPMPRDMMLPNSDSNKIFGSIVLGYPVM